MLLVSARAMVDGSVWCLLVMLLVVALCVLRAALERGSSALNLFSIPTKKQPHELRATRGRGGIIANHECRTHHGPTRDEAAAHSNNRQRRARSSSARVASLFLRLSSRSFQRAAIIN